MPGALEGLRVLDLTRLLPGGFCTLLLADMGAEVLKVEDTAAGDYIRWMPPYYGGEAEQKAGVASAYFLALNRNKRSLRLNLKDERGRDVLLRLVEDYDVLVESFRPGVMDRLGVGYDALRERNPRVIYCPISGYGQDGPLTARSGHDTNYLALNGLLGLTGRRGGPPIQSAGQIADLGGGGLMAAVGILAAVIERERSGEGQMVDVSMTDGALSWLAMVAARYFAEQQVPHRGEPELTGGIACYFPYEAKDGGWVSLGALEPKFWQNWCNGVGRPDLIEKQFEHPDSEAGAEVAAVFRERTRDEWTAFAGEHDCCLEPILDLDEALGSELVRARGMVVELDQPGIGAVKQVGAPIKLSRTPADTSGAAPALGADTDDVLREVGIDPQPLRDAGVV
ncbi:MAG TPA: CaiB/BaiF CoA-transferase family protein [Solirubrobacterales bacterium]|nr:CaiB/BaiF CoA-transferase family protein [Solirubrobacterales bacterium]